METRKSGISRRSVLRRIGAGTAIAWSAPVLSSLRTPAFAQYPGTCQPGQDSCDGPEFGCGNNEPRCFCTGTAEGGLICGCFDKGLCPNYQLCTASSQCPSGQFCTTLNTPDCCGGICVALCTAACAGGAGAAAGEPPAAT